MAPRFRNPASSKRQRKPQDKGFSRPDLARLARVVESRPETGESGMWTKADVERLRAGLTIPGARRRLEEGAKSPALDRARLAKNVAPAAALTPEDVDAQKRWERAPTRMDFEGVDSPFGSATIGEPSESAAEAMEKRKQILKKAKVGSLRMPGLKMDRPDRQERPPESEPQPAQEQPEKQVMDADAFYALQEKGLEAAEKWIRGTITTDEALAVLRAARQAEQETGMMMAPTVRRLTEALESAKLEEAPPTPSIDTDDQQVYDETETTPVEVTDERPGPDASDVGERRVQPSERRVSEGAGAEPPAEQPAEERVPGVEGERGVGELDSVPTPSDQEVRTEPDRDGDIPQPSMELGDTGEDTGSGDGLALQQLAPTPLDLGRDFILDPRDITLPRTPTERWNANIAAIRLAQQLELEDRKPTPEEQAVLAKYAGFGDSAFETAFRGYGGDPDTRQAWRERGEELRELVGPDEYRAIERSRINAFYTTPEVINATWRALERMGVDKLAQPRVLEPSAGSGRYLGLQPTDLAARSKRTAVELDTTTGNILKRVYPNAATYVMGFQEAPIPDDSVDVAVSNVPFGNIPVLDPSYRKGRDLLTKQVHNYFFAKTLDKLRPGGVLGFVTSHHTLDAPTAQPIREYLAEHADLLGAIRLPEGAFPDTDVVTDIVFMQKREPGQEPGDTSWVNSSKMTAKSKYGNNVEVDVNQYFQDNPDMVLGEHSAAGSMYARESYTVLGDTANLEEAMLKAVERLPADVISEGGSTAMDDVLRGNPDDLAAYSNVPIGSYVIGENDDVYVRKVYGLEKAGLSSKDDERVKDMLEIRDAAREVLQLQRDDHEDDEIAGAQRRLNVQYDGFVKKHGNLNDKQNARLMRFDPEGPFLRSLEEQSKDKEAGWNKMAIFSKRVLRGLPDRAVDTAADAMAVSLDEEGHLDFEMMGGLLGRSADQVRDELSQQNLVFKNPVGDWETADEYLTGSVRDKLGTAILASSSDPAYQRNVEALTSVQPEDLPPSAIQVSMGAPWIPAEEYSEFVSQLLGASRGYDYRSRKPGLFYKFIPSRGVWIKGDRVYGVQGLSTGQWGTPDMPAEEIIWKMLQASPIEVKKKDDEGNEYRDEKATAAAMEKAQKIEEEFDRWVWADPGRATRLARIYNDKFNDMRPRVYDGSHLTFPGMNLSWASKLHPHQRDAIWRVIQDGTALLAHEVGFGKSAVMAASGMELRRLGMAKKNIYVVPKATHEQFRRQFQELYPHAKVLFPGDDDFKTENRPEFMSRVATGDWDAVIMSDTQFRRIPVKPETEASFIRDEMNAVRAALIAEAEESGGKKTLTHKNLQKSLERMEVRLGKLVQDAQEVSDRTIHFEDLGIDQMFVDEADNYKNLHFATKMGRVKGLPNSESKRAWDMYMKVRYLQNKGKGRGVVFATGTPVANTIAELWTMMRYLQEPALERRGLEHFDAWARTFGGMTNGIEQSPTGAYRVAQRFAKFVNVPELSQIWQATADIRVASEVPEIMERLPRLVDDQGQPRRTVVTAPPDDQLRRYMVRLGERAERLKGGNVDPREDNMLKISSDARMAALDMRMVDPTARPNPQGKIPLAAKNIAEIYREEAKEKGAQLVFLDIGTPKAAEKVDDDAPPSEDDLTGAEAQVLRDVYNVIRNQLIANGVAEDDIAFIHDAKTNEARARLFEAVNSGEKRVLIGSTGKLGVGVNVQERAAAAHHLDVPWRPRDIEQREGRVLRQGNKVYGPEFDASGEQVVSPGRGVRIFNYVTEGSFDAYMWQAVEVKAKAIKAIMKRDIQARAMEDIDALVISAAEAKALASGNPDVLRAVELKNEVGRLQLLRASHRDAVATAQMQRERLPVIIQGQQQAIGKLERDLALAARSDDAKFAMNVEGTNFTERTKAGEDLRKSLEEMPVAKDAGSAVRRNLGGFRGFRLQATHTDRGYQLLLNNPETGLEHPSSYMDTRSLPAAVGLISRVENIVKAIPTRLENARADLNKSETSLRTYEEQAARPFDQGGQLQDLQQQLKAIEDKLQKVEDMGQ